MTAIGAAILVCSSGFSRSSAAGAALRRGYKQEPMLPFVGDLSLSSNANSIRPARRLITPRPVANRSPAMKLPTMLKSFAFDSPDAAAEAMIEQLEPVTPERVDLPDAAGRALAQPLVADRPSPACDVSAMDGYAVRLSDMSPGRLNVAGEASIGQAPPAMPKGSALRIFTGGPVPEGAEAVIPREQLGEHSDAIEIPGDLDVRPGQNIRRRGENGQAGETVVESGAAVTPPVAAAAATFGTGRVSVVRRLRIAAIVTGNEVHGLGAEVAPWQLRDSNGPTLEAMFAPLPWVDWQGAARASDERDKLKQTIQQALDGGDALLLTGGVSMGDYDFVPQVLAELGCRTLFHRLPIRPGKPILAAIGPGGQAVFGLPGNPVSVMTTARRIAAPVLRHRAGFAHTAPPAATVELIERDEKTLPLYWWRPVRLIEHGRARLVRTRGSGDLVSTARSDGFVEIPPGATGCGPWPFYRWSLEA